MQRNKGLHDKQAVLGREASIIQKARKRIRAPSEERISHCLSNNKLQNLRITVSCLFPYFSWWQWHKIQKGKEGNKKRKPYMQKMKPKAIINLGWLEDFSSSSPSSSSSSIIFKHLSGYIGLVLLFDTKCSLLNIFFVIFKSM